MTDVVPMPSLEQLMKPPMVTSQMKARAQIMCDAYAAFGRGDIQSILDIAADDVEMIVGNATKASQALMPEYKLYDQYHGKTGMKEFFTRLATAVTTKLTSEHILPLSDNTLLMINSCDVHSNSTKLTDPHGHTRVFDEWTFNDRNQLVKFQETFDTLYMSLYCSQPARSFMA